MTTMTAGYGEDSHPFNELRCADTDNDQCDDCSSGEVMSRMMV